MFFKAFCSVERLIVVGVANVIVLNKQEGLPFGMSKLAEQNKTLHDNFLVVIKIVLDVLFTTMV